MPLNLNTYDGNSSQITTSSPLSQKFKENQPSEKMNIDRLERLERKDFLNNSTLSPIPSSNSFYSSSSINSLVKNNKTMSNDELFTAIYKSKRKLNIKNDSEISTGSTSTTTKTIDDSLIDISNYVPDDNNKIGTRHSWSPESQTNSIKKLVSPSCINQEMSPKNTKTAAAMTRLDFKRLLLQQSTKNRSSSLSAAEQLKLSNPSLNSSSNSSKGTGRQVNYGINDNNNKQTTANSTIIIKSLNTLSTLDHQRYNSSTGSYLSRGQQKTIFPNPYQINKHDSINSFNHQKSIWKYQIPRSNILSCTIIEDVAAEETAVKQFLESPPSPLPSATCSSSSLSSLTPSATLINDSDNNVNKNKQIYKNNLKSSENNDIDNIFSNKLFEFNNSSNNDDSNNSKLVSAHFEAESLKKRNNELKAQFLSNNKLDNNIIIFDEKNQIKSGPTKDTADIITPSVIVDNITNNSTVSRNTTTSALETAL
ncbi:GSCOCG00007262001-RA-CDS [Cotesia congregata]|nr:GSCOCG00007262001-RA-CDS [Cotesia congregata]